MCSLALLFGKPEPDRRALNWLAFLAHDDDYVLLQSYNRREFFVMAFLSDLFSPPYYAVIFSSERSGTDPAGYAATADRMLELARQADGYLGVETLGSGAAGITVSYWRDEAAITAWKNNVEHEEARRMGRRTWYKDYRLRVARVERAYGLKSSDEG